MNAAGSFLRSVTTTTNFAYRLDYGFDWNVFAYTLGLVALTGLFVGFWPAFRFTGTNLNAALHEGHRQAGANHHQVRSALTVVQVAGSLALLVIAGLFVRSLEHAEHLYLGFEPEHVLNVMLDPHQIGYDETQSKAFYRELKDRVRSMSGVESVSLSYVAPLQYPGHTGAAYVEGHALAAGEHPLSISFNSVDPAYMNVMRVPLLRGRNFTDSDNDGERPV